MRQLTTFNGEDMTLSEAVARIVNGQIDELVERCVRQRDAPLLRYSSGGLWR